MELAIANYFGVREHIIVPNISYGLSGMHECDVFLIKRTGIAVEVEIKRSVADLKADFKKRHQHIDKQHRITEFYYAIPFELLDKCIGIIPEEAGIITCRTYLNYKKIESVSAHIERKSTRIKGARKLTIEEQLKVAKLGCMRIWTLKKKLIENERKTGK